jgi:hypothetical protein
MAQVFEADALTNETIIREMTDEEVAQMEADAARFAEEEQQRQNELTTKAAAKAALLNRLGITAEEAALLLK